MAISSKGAFLMGMGLFISFFIVLFLIFSPFFNGKNGLDFSDELFNKLSKGSSYFIPKLLKNIETFAGKPFQATLNLEGNKADEIAKLFTAAGAKVEVQGTTLKLEGDLGAVLKIILRDADQMFNNQGAAVSSAYGYDEKEVLQNWWLALNAMDKFFKKNLKIEESKMVTDIAKKGLEPAYNFYKIEPQRVLDRAGLMTFLLVFYVVYTLWWGYAIYYLFEGIGLSMKKAKVKKEV